MEETQILHTTKNDLSTRALIPQKKDFIPVKKGRFGFTEYGILALTFMLLFGSVYAVYLLQPEFEHLHMEQVNSTLGMIIIGIGLFLTTITISFLIYLLFLYIRYKPVAAVSDEELPTCTIIVPAYNEGKLVYETLHSLAGSDYPHGKMQIIAVDDGSKDDTWLWILKAKEELGDRVTTFKQPKNKGKRHALYRGFQMGTGDIFITVDSDSIVKKDTIRNMASPFAVNEKCGGVAGNVRVLNNEKELIPRMLNVNFVFSFEFVRSAQSMLGSVMCTPGALAAYRRDLVMNCLEDWVNQTFMGRPSDIGEDRAMTNMILKQGYHILFQRNAYVFTNIPKRYKNLYKMFIRWERSNVRENIMMSKFAFSDFREGPKVGTRILLCMQWLKLVMSYPLILLMLWFIINHTMLFISSTFFGILILSSVQAFFFAKRNKNIPEAFWAYTYSIFYAFTLFWITPYAIATASKSGWLTRELSVKES
ncbi:glycosyl transferase family 2 [Elizabethkingia meningoseptica]|uniref:glycosyltransferase family 2 protein n=1 Tax=Elizabethkingia meningoseptica TaxID=238 RepID=UPI0003820967|nr:glycosyltransferase [Elizabethkingia meningoseptica]AQX05243.1 glycosyl transferase family 2 [Elizabethkingia meningoseptica]AQX47288.1 glycosyl transferase family 2 [Elizabethkingia meningoseptica]KUY21791.1 glycosyl transferase family 2 [Elizabethkingia meningoseptica]OPB76403.1 glycosyl transferase family 2 [Elizabethkingia meningoseptica]SQG05841.1 Poly-beta-1,6-N-acetyl-D-glucosamine synthase [Elizabethkingia meningoseptica]